jgi:protein subunit release factor B
VNVRVKVKEGAERVKVSTGFDWRYPILFRCLHRIPTMSDAYPPLDNDLLRRLHALGVRPVDVEERFVRGTGPGGQKINKTSSTVWLRHGPTGVEVRCQRERSQADNRATAWAELADRVEKRRRLAAAAVEQAREKERRRHRQKSRGQKARMVAEKKHHARHKALRGRVASDD